MTASFFAHVDQWVFDLDNTLYPPSARLFDQIEVRMTDWVMEALGVHRPEADRLRQHYYHTYGTTLAGLMREHDVDPAPYLTHVHEISLGHLEADTALGAAIKALPGKCIVFTNGTEPYATRVLAALGLDGLFEAIYGVEHADFRPKPEAAAFAQVFEKAAIEPRRAAMFEDTPKNLAVPHALGMRTVHVAPQPEPAPHIHHHTDQLAAFLSQLVAR